MNTKTTREASTNTRASDVVRRGRLASRASASVRCARETAEGREHRDVKIIAEGTPEKVSTVKESYTGKFIKELMGDNSMKKTA